MVVSAERQAEARRRKPMSTENTQDSKQPAIPPLPPATGSEDFDDYPEEYWDNEDVCEMCGGDGVIEYLDHPEVWGEDCPSYQNHLLPCPECRRRELAERRKANPPNPTI
jgi:alpha-D-ribose 1-methylphosphonate 5-phosphate C-P lyase